MIEKVLSMLIAYVKQGKKTTKTAVRTVIVYQAAVIEKVLSMYVNRRKECINHDQGLF